MITATRRQRRAPTEPKRLSLRSWQDGYQSTKDSNRTGAKGLDIALNQILKQDGTVSQRPSTLPYGPQPIGTVLGDIVEFTKRSGTTVTNYLGCIQVVGGVAQFYYAKGEDTTWTVAPGKTFDVSSRAHPCPIRDVDSSYNDQDKVLILNSTDYLAYLDINTMIIIPFTALPAASVPTLTPGSGVSGTTNFPNRYRISAGNRGETAASVAASTYTSKLRSEWSAATEYVDVTIQRVAGATKYHIYYGTEAGSEVYIDSVDDPGTGTTVTWRDSGVSDQNIYRPAPASDTTAGPICTRATQINGQVFMVGDRANPKYTRYGGTGLSVLDFSPYGGGGYEPVGGNKEIPVKVAAFRSNGGDPAITVLCKGTNGFGKRYIFTPRTLGNVAYFQVSEENGNDGTEAPDSVILANDQLWYLSRDGGKTTLTKAQVQTILSTDSITDNIQADISKLNTSSLEYSWGLHFEGRNYWGVAAGSAKNNQIWVLDLNNMRRGAWMIWELAADWGFLYNDNSGRTHFCVLINSKILEVTDTVATQDNGVAFPTTGRTGILGFSEDLREWAIVHQVIFVVQRPQGTINVAVKGKTEDSPLDLAGSEPFTADTDIVGWSEPVTGGWSSPTRGWSGIERVPQQYGIERTEITIDDIDEEMNWLYCEWGTTQANCSYELTDIIIVYTPTGTKD